MKFNPSIITLIIMIIVGLLVLVLLSPVILIFLAIAKSVV